MKRRSALKFTSALVGAGLSASFVAGVLSGCAPAKSGTSYTPIFFEPDKFEFLNALAEVLIPSDDTPGASELELAQWIDTIVKECYTEEQQKSVSKHLNVVYNALSGDANMISLQSLESTNDQDTSNAYTSTKSIVATAYLSQEYVGTKLLNYLPVPGIYDACIPISETNGKAWTI